MNTFIKLCRDTIKKTDISVKVIIVSILSIIVIGIILQKVSKPSINNNQESDYKIPVVKKVTPQLVCPEYIIKYKEYIKKENEIKSKKIQEYSLKLKELDDSDTEKWFIQYKKLAKEYEKYIGKRVTIYDVYPNEDIEFMMEIVEAEVTGTKYFINKAHVASVIFNRLINKEFPNDIYSVLTDEHQFSTYSNGRYMNVEVTNTTRLACEYVFEFGDTTNGALYFDSKMEKSWAYGIQELIMVDEVGHSFYK